MARKRGMGLSQLTHPFAPVLDAQSRVLVLGSFPSVKSRENAFYYGHPQNRFWRVLAALFAENVPNSITEKAALLHRHHIALWDVVASCTIIGSADSTLSPFQINDIPSLLRETDIHTIYANGQKAGKLYQTHLEKETGIPIQILPSTSPANAAWSLERLLKAWKPLHDAAKKAETKPTEHLSNTGGLP